VVVLVVAAMTGSCRRRSKRFNTLVRLVCPIVVPSTRWTRPDADPDRVRTELSKHDVIPEEWASGHFVNVSARTGAGIDALLDAILLQAEILELRAPRDGLASGIVIESSVEKGRGAVATVLVKKGNAAHKRSDPRRVRVRRGARHVR